MTAGYEIQAGRGVELRAVLAHKLLRRGVEPSSQSHVRAQDLPRRIVQGYGVLHRIKGSLPFSLAARHNLEEPRVLQRDRCLVRQGLGPQYLLSPETPLPRGVAEDQDPYRLVLRQQGGENRGTPLQLLQRTAVGSW